MEHIITTEGVSKIFNQGMPDEFRAINNISLNIGKGEIVVLKGPSGSGKTTLLSLLGCMSRPTEGRILINGKDVAKLPERFLSSIRQRSFGFVFQQFNLIRGISVLENVILPLYPSEWGLSVLRRNALEILDRLGIADKRKMPVQRLSGGEQQRTAIARSLINDPRIIFADEPTAHLDTKTSEDFIRIVSDLNQDGRTVVMATHDPLIYDLPLVHKTVEMRDGMVRRVIER